VPEQDPYSELEQEAERQLEPGPDDQADDEGPAPDETSVMKLLRKAVDKATARAKAAEAQLAEREHAGYQRGREETLVEVATSAQREQQHASFKIPPSLRDRFADVDPGDRDAWAQRVEALQREGIRWGEPTPEAMVAASTALFSGAQARGEPTGGGLLHQAARDPSSVRPDQLDQLESELNAQVHALGAQARAGIMG
jgi:hypothetical protein